MTSLWRHLWPNYDTLDFKILTQCVKMLGERILKVWRRYLHRFRRYRKKTRGGGARNSPPPSGARVKHGDCNVWRHRLVLAGAARIFNAGRKQWYHGASMGPGTRKIRGRIGSEKKIVHMTHPIMSMHRTNVAFVLLCGAVLTWVGVNAVWD